MGGFPSVSFLSFPLAHSLPPSASPGPHPQPYLGAYVRAHKLWTELWRHFLSGSARNLGPTSPPLPPPHPSALPALSSPELFPGTSLCWHQAAGSQLQLCPVTLNKAPETSRLLFSWHGRGHVPATGACGGQRTTSGEHPCLRQVFYMLTAACARLVSPRAPVSSSYLAVKIP